MYPYILDTLLYQGFQIDVLPVYQGVQLGPSVVVLHLGEAGLAGVVVWTVRHIVDHLDVLLVVNLLRSFRLMDPEVVHEDGNPPKLIGPPQVQ